MADRNITERLQPALLDRLTDLEPDKPTEGRDARVIDINRLRDIIRRDLSWLLNCNNLDSEIDADAYPHVATSVLNYGVREVSGSFSTTQRAGDVRKSMQAAIRRFEPRINEGTLQISLKADENPSRSMVVFDIVADMWAEPIPLELYLRSEVDITTGEIDLRDLG